MTLLATSANEGLATSATGIASNVEARQRRALGEKRRGEEGSLRGERKVESLDGGMREDGRREEREQHGVGMAEGKFVAGSAGFRLDSPSDFHMDFLY